MKDLSKKLDPQSHLVIETTINHYLNNQPAFYSLIRPQELYLFFHYRKYMTGEVLDFGCADGFFASLLGKFTNHKIHTGIDIDDSLINHAGNSKAYKKIIKYDGESMPLESKSYDCVISNCVFEHLPHLDSNLTDIHRVLKPKGYLLTSVMTDKWDKYLFGTKLLGNRYAEYMRRKQVHHNLLSKNKWRQKYSKHNFKIIHEGGYLPQNTSQLLDLAHYLSIGSLIYKKIFDSWVPIQNWHKTLKLTALIHAKVKRSLFCNPDRSSALFYVLQKAR